MLRVEIANTDERSPALRVVPDFLRHDVGERESSVEHIVQIQSVHAHDPFASAECYQAVIAEPAFTHEKPSRPSSFVFDLTVKGVQIRSADWKTFPLRLQQICLARQLETAVDLLPHDAKRCPGREPIRAEHIFQELLVGESTGLGIEATDFQSLSAARARANSILLGVGAAAAGVAGLGDRLPPRRSITAENSASAPGIGSSVGFSVDSPPRLPKRQQRPNSYGWIARLEESTEPLGLARAFASVSELVDVDA